MENYFTSSKGIGGQIKRRYADFIVEEITPQGRVCRVERFSDEKKISEQKDELQIPANSNPEKFNQLHLDLEKINKDINFIIKELTRFLQCSKKRVGYAGLKDKRAITCQRISVFRPDIARLEIFARRGVAFRNAKWEEERIKLGNLKGNKFTITIRDISTGEEETREMIKKCFNEMEKGVANYFGEQRFGGARKVTHLVGREFIKENYKDAVMLYLTATYPEEESETKNARIELSKTLDFSKASREFPVKYRYERSIIHHLCRYPNDFIGAFRNLPKQMIYLFTHAYQSYLFNKIIDERVKEGIGIKAIDEDILEEGVATAALFGYESKFAKGAAGKIEKKVLKEEKIELGDFKVKSVPELSSKGARRKIVLKPENMKIVEVSSDEIYTGKVKAVLSFILPKGTYATTLLREIMKSEE